MIEISAIVIAKNEEERIVDCLDTLSFCNEIIVVDNGSTDRTSDIAKRMGAQVYSVESHNFSDIRNFALSKSSMSWVFYVDADERADLELAKSIRDINVSEAVAYRVVRKNFYLGKNEWPKYEKMERVFLKDKLTGWKGQLHESPIVDGEMGELGGFLLHYTHRNLSEMLSKTIEWSKIEAKLRFDAGHPRMAWWRFPRVMVTTFFDYYVLQRGYRIGTAGLIESMYQSFSIFVTYAILWELQRKK